MKKVLYALLLSVLAASCGGTKKAQDAGEQKANPVAVTFNADSAYAFCEQQCQFGPRVMNSEAHELCGQWIARKFRSYGLEVVEQKATLRGYDGTPLQSTNIIASYKPGVAPRLLVCAHWDSRPWADNDPDEANHRKPVMAANDGASGVAVMLEAARLLPDSLGVGIDFVCFDAEDWGIPQWADAEDPGDTWALGAQHWAANPHCDPNTIRFGILLDMVGAADATFYREYYSDRYASDVVNLVWDTAARLGYSNMFINRSGAGITDDHTFVNRMRRIPTIDIIDTRMTGDGTFYPHWHTTDDTLDKISRETLGKVGNVLMNVIY